jgi:hypothetical protein
VRCPLAASSCSSSSTKAVLQELWAPCKQTQTHVVLKSGTQLMPATRKVTRVSRLNSGF